MTLSRRWVRGALWVVLLMTGPVVARAQEVSGSISGTVRDAKGASVSGAVVTLTQTDQAQIERTVKTNAAGFYTAGSLPLGPCSETIAVKGFKTATITGLVLNANDELKVDQTMAAGDPQRHGFGGYPPGASQPRKRQQRRSGDGRPVARTGAQQPEL